jgi:hypothetical protein
MVKRHITYKPASVTRSLPVDARRRPRTNRRGKNERHEGFCNYSIRAWRLAEERRRARRPRASRRRLAAQNVGPLGQQDQHGNSPQHRIRVSCSVCASGNSRWPTPVPGPGFRPLTLSYPSQHIKKSGSIPRARARPQPALHFDGLSLQSRDSLDCSQTPEHERERNEMHTAIVFMTSTRPRPTSTHGLCGANPQRMRNK